MTAPTLTVEVTRPARARSPRKLQQRAAREDMSVRELLINAISSTCCLDTAAEELGVSRSTLWREVRRQGINLVFTRSASA